MEVTHVQAEPARTAPGKARREYSPGAAWEVRVAVAVKTILSDTETRRPENGSEQQDVDQSAK